MLELIQIAVRNLALHRRRTLMLGGAMTGVTALLLFLLGLSNGVQSTLLQSATTLMSGHVNVAGFYKVTRGQSSPVVTHYPKLLELIQREVPELASVSQRGRGTAKVISDSSSMPVALNGLDIEAEPTFRQIIRTAEGSIDDLARPGTILLFESQAKKLEVKVGDMLTLTGETVRGSTNTQDVRVVAIARDVGLLSSFNVFVPNATLRALYQLHDDATGALLIYLKRIEDAPAVQQRLRQALASARYELLDEETQPYWQKLELVTHDDWTGQRLDVTTWKVEIAFATWTSDILNVLSLGLMFVLIVIIAVGLMNTLWISIRERTQEVGTLRAIGMQRSRVVLMFALEAFVLSVLGTGIGAVLGTVICALLNAVQVPVPYSVQLFLMEDRLRLLVDVESALISMAVITACTTAIALIPSFLAARLKPITAIHHVG
ncbi:ABC transporter permease [Archangium sp.]|uniref:ABC transporter permease n=1 Tax=Archangium sp. TaxID=1872627 RepID=UPI002D48EC3B|nr:FtsX-like permease family protein [Archangium sp.]HYO59432.1 FtsX-like permease family protein [Archangium sp.]